jgi:hypothetical protein
MKKIKQNTEKECEYTRGAKMNIKFATISKNK